MKIYFLAIFLCFLTLNVAGQKEIFCIVSGSSCNFTSQIVDENDKVKIRVEPAGSDLDRVTEAFFTSSSIFYIPSELFDVFANLKELHMYGQNVQEIKPNTFKNAKNLELLWIHENKFSNLYANMFEGAVNLWNFGCGRANVDKFDVDVNSFAGLANLEIVQIWELPLQYLHRDTFKTNLNLKQFDLSSNKLTMIHHKMFSHLSLNYLDLRNNECINSRFINDPDRATIENALRDCSTSYRIEEFEENFNRFDDKFKAMYSLFGFLDERNKENTKQIEDIKYTIEKIYDMLNHKA